MAGLIFITSDHPLEKLVAFNFKVPFTTAGFVYVEYIEGKPKKKVYLIDLFKIYDENFVVNMTLDSVTNLALIRRASIRWLKLDAREEAGFRMAIAATLAILERPPLEILLRQMVGLERKNITGLDAIFVALEKVGISFPTDLPKANPNMLSLADEYSPMSHLLSLLSSQFGKEDPRISALTKLGELEELELAPCTPQVYARKHEMAVHRTTAFLKAAFPVFLDMFTLDPEFLIATMASWHTNNAPVMSEEPMETKVNITEIELENYSRKDLEILYRKVRKTLSEKK